MIKCPYCGHDVPAGRASCQNCGQTLEGCGL